MKIRQELITPEIAKNWLENNNPHNRNIYQATVQSYARDMKLGLWKTNNQGIGFDKDGNLLDGQHRLSAVVASGKSIEFVIFYGLDKSSRGTIDGGKPRGAGDKLQLDYGITNANLIAAIVRSMFSIVYSRGSSSKFSMGTIKMAIDLYEKEIDMVIRNKKSVPLLGFAPALAGMVFTAKCNPNETMIFAYKYFSGENLNNKSPILAFRNMMLSGTKNKNSGAYRLLVPRAYFLCFNHFLNGTPLKLIRDTNFAQEYFLTKQQSDINKLLSIIL